MVGQYGETGRAFIVATMAPWGEREMGPRDVLAELRPQFAQVTLANVRAFAPSGLDAGGGSGLEVIVTAPSFEQAADYSAQMTQALRNSPDIVGVRRAYDINTPGFDINVHRAMAREIGVEAQAISDAVRTFFASAEVTEFISQDRQYPVILQAPDDRRAAIENLRGVNVRTESGALVPLDGLVTLERRASVAAFNRFSCQMPVISCSSPCRTQDAPNERTPIPVDIVISLTPLVHGCVVPNTPPLGRNDSKNARNNIF